MSREALLARNNDPRRAELAVVVGFLLLCILFTGQFPPFSNPNELSRLEMVYAFVEHGTFAIDKAIPILGDHEDKAAADGRFYSNKAPGLALAAIPVYRLLRIFFPPPRSPSATIFVLLRMLVVSSVCAIGLAQFQRRIRSSAAAPLIGFAVAFGTPFLFYARTFFSHAWTASLLFLAWDLLRRSEEAEHVRRVAMLPFAAGLIATWGVISEYPAAAIGLCLAARVFLGRSWKRAWLFTAGAAVPLLLLGLYNAVCFGSPVVLSSAREASSLYSSLGAEGRFGFGLPSISIAARYLADPSRGLILFSPFVVWAIPGFWKWWRSGSERWDMAFALASVGIYFLVMTGYTNWHGGWSLGDRYLLSALFLAGLALPHALGTPVSRGLFLAAVAYSTTVHFLLTASWPHFPPNIGWPPGSATLWFLSRGWSAPSLLSSAPFLSLVSAAGVTLVAGIAALLVCWRGISRPIVSALAGLALAVGTLLYRPEPSFGARLWRAAVFGAYSGLDPGREELRRVVVSAQTPAERGQAMGAWRVYGRRP